MTQKSGISTRGAATVAAMLLAGTAWPALAQSTTNTAAPDAPQTSGTTPAGVNTNASVQNQSVGVTPVAGDTQEQGDIVVTGYRASLQSSTNAKRNSTGFTDSIFAEDIGKFPDTNIAETFNRVPGVTISRDITGEGVQITIRGLGTNFTRVLLNNAPIAVASTGGDGQQSTNREVDLNVFPTELFTSLTVNKTSQADQLEGGAAGTVNMRSARAFDHPGTHLTYSGQTTNFSNWKDWGYRGSVLASMTSGHFGALLGFAGQRNRINTKGYETVGLTNANLSATQDTLSTRNSTGGGNWTIPATVPAGANIPGVATGTTIDQAFLLAQNPGANITQLDNGILPRLGRYTDEYGRKDRISMIGSLEWKSDTFHAYVDGMYSREANNMQRIDMDWIVRNGAVIPVNTQYDQADCTNGCTVTKGTYYNSNFFLEYRPYFEHTKYWGVNPGIEWNATRNLKIDLNGNYTKSDFHRESPSVLVSTALGNGAYVTYDNTQGAVPSIKSSIDLNNPANFGWNSGSRLNIQDEYRSTKTKGFRGDVTWGGSDLNLRFGGAYDDVSRRISASDNSQAWQNAVCGDNPSVYLLSPNTQPPCEGLSTSAPPSNYPRYPAYGTGYTTGLTGPVTYAGSLVPQAAVPNYLVPGPLGFVTVDWNKFAAATNYAQFHANSLVSSSSNTGASGGFIGEKTLGFYAEVNGDKPIGDNRLSFNAGIRWVHTDQSVGGYVSLSDPRNTVVSGGTSYACPNGPAGTGTRDGSCYPNVVNFVYTESKYSNWLPSASAAFHIGDHTVLRAAASRTMTRPNPNSELPGLNFSSVSADVGTVGNPNLTPYLSTNFDVGAEYYTGHEGYVGFAAFRKAITGFTTNGNITVPFSSLAQYGVTYDSLTPAQQTAINSRGGPTAATVVLTQQVNASGTLVVTGLEGNWVQPLDFLLGAIGIRGAGFSANVTLINQSGSGNAPAVATGVSPFTYNLTAYYERHGISLRLSEVFNKGFVSTNANQNGITLASLYSDSYRQLDFGGSADLGKLFDAPHLPELTLDVQNITKSKQRSYFQFSNATYSYFSPGRQILVGLRGRF